MTSSSIADSFPTAVQERVRVVREAPSEGEFVLYWIHHAMRAEENPALDAALLAAKSLDLPLFVYQELLEDESYASDRLHTFVLQGACDLQEQFAARRIGYAIHLSRSEDRGSHLIELAQRAALVVTEEMPTWPIRRTMQTLYQETTTPLWAVDAACVVPMQMTKKAYDRAFAYRRATKKLYRERLTRTWQEQPSPSSPFVPADLPFKPLDFSKQSIADLLADCEIDHAIGPIPHTPGGSAAGYRRWQNFRDTGLKHYAKRRNNALIEGNSRLSPYFHYGMISPLRVAREAKQFKHDSAEKFLDELLIWREVAYSFCFHQRDHESLSAMPKWAQQTLRAHEEDPRHDLYDWETLARGKTGDALWNAAQHSLLIHGELHNNVRMTWGKAFLPWTADPPTALAYAIDLNHRYALDGRDPASYGGILWCFGQFDRPFQPEKAVFGSIRQRPTETHARRLDPKKYAKKVHAPLTENVPRVAVIGAGLSGLFCARTLADHGLKVTVFEKSRGVGGRMATRRVSPERRQSERMGSDPFPEKTFFFDHGAQYFTARDPRFLRYVKAWQEQEIVAAWKARLGVSKAGTLVEKEDQEIRYVGIPRMTSIGKHLAKDLPIQFETRIECLEKVDQMWKLIDTENQSHGNFDWVILTAPAQQTVALLPENSSIKKQAEATSLSACWAGLLCFRERLPITPDAIFIEDSPLRWAARNNSKPGRPSELETWVVHANPGWSDEHVDEEPEVIRPQLEKAFAQAIGQSLPEFAYSTAHRWRYSIPGEPLPQRCLIDAKGQLIACGDWCGGPRVEGAFLSGMAAAGGVLRHLPTTQKTLFELSQLSERSGQGELFEEE
ncbi:Deoxyribodipyrimidine photo-lyase type II [Planctomycetales bacterium 10988]|nr:Deoxyribodipyrimidine photo-lyase type II [Planctomycetales bacterium 10988]